MTVFNVEGNDMFPARTFSFALWQDMESRVGLGVLSKPDVTTWSLFL